MSSHMDRIEQLIAEKNGAIFRAEEAQKECRVLRAALHACARWLSEGQTARDLPGWNGTSEQDIVDYFVARARGACTHPERLGREEDR